MKLPLPPLVPLGLVLLVDGEPAAAEFCAKTAHTKLLPRLHALQATEWIRPAYSKLCIRI